MKTMDLEALLVALVLAPATYSRNRFFQLFVDPRTRYVRRRASLVRSILRHAGFSAVGLEALEITPADGGKVAVSYVVSSLGLKRTMTLAALELSLVRFALARRNGAWPSDSDPDRATIEGALQRLSGLQGDEVNAGGLGGTGYGGDFVLRAPDAPSRTTAPPSPEGS